MVRTPRVALVCDFVEENWPSMDLIAEMLFENLHRDHASTFSVTRFCPSMRLRFSRLHLAGVGSISTNADRFCNRFLDYPRWLKDRMRDIDLFHVVDHSYAQLVHELPAARTVVSCHDLDAFRCVLEPEREKRSRPFRIMTSRILAGLQKAAHLITVSPIIRDEIVQHGLFPPEQVTVIPNGVHPSCSPETNPASEVEVERLLGPEPAGAIWLLNVGSTIPRKRLDVLLRVFAAVRREIPDVRLIRVGGGMTRAQLQLARDLTIDESVFTFPRLSWDVLAAVYRKADLLLQTSEAEGFGLPVIESLACGCPVVVSDLPVLREVAGTAATYCPVADVGAWKAAVIALIEERTQSPGSWEYRRKLGIARAARFSWAESARQTAQVYRKVLQI